MYVIVNTHENLRHISSYCKDQNQATKCNFSGKENWIVERKQMEESSIVENEEGQWLDFLPAKTSEDPGRVGAEVGFIHYMINHQLFVYNSFHKFLKNKTKCCVD